jgi:hypothetical protein
MFWKAESLFFLRWGLAMLPSLVLLLGLNWSSIFSVSWVTDNREMCQLTPPSQ